MPYTSTVVSKFWYTHLKLSQSLCNQAQTSPIIFLWNSEISVRIWLESKCVTDKILGHKLMYTHIHTETQNHSIFLKLNFYFKPKFQSIQSLSLTASPSSTSAQSLVCCLRFSRHCRVKMWWRDNWSWIVVTYHC